MSCSARDGLRVVSNKKGGKNVHVWVIPIGSVSIHLTCKLWKWWGFFLLFFWRCGWGVGGVVVVVFCFLFFFLSFILNVFSSDLIKEMRVWSEASTAPDKALFLKHYAVGTHQKCLKSTQNMFSWRNKKKYSLDTPSYLEIWPSPENVLLPVCHIGCSIIPLFLFISKKTSLTGSTVFDLITTACTQVFHNYWENLW